MTVRKPASRSVSGTLGALAVVLMAFPGVAHGTITPTSSAPAIAAALDGPPLVTNASFETLPPAGAEDPNATSTTPLGGFPTQGPSYAILTTGAASYADDANAEGNKTYDHEHTGVRGVGNDVSVIKLDFTPPASASCLSFDVRILTEEFPEFVSGPFSDTFLAEVGVSDWQGEMGELVAPRNFARDPDGGFIDVNTAFGMAEVLAAGTTYDGSTPTLHVQAPLATPNPTSVYLSIMDLADGTNDTAAFVDDLDARTGTCVSKTTIVHPQTRITQGPSRRTTRRRVTVRFVAPGAPQSAEPGFECKLDRKPFRPCRSPYRKRVKLGRHKFQVRAVVGGQVDPTPAKLRFRVVE